VNRRQLRFSRVLGSFAICRLTPDGVVPDWALGGKFFSITGSPEELSIVCPAARVPDGVHHECDWACFKLEGPFPFSETGILVSFVHPLSERAIPIFALSTFDTDYVLVKEAWVEKALEAWRDAGHTAL
jgi:uncharacterized protein